MKKSMIILPIFSALMASTAYAGETWNAENVRSAPVSSVQSKLQVGVERTGEIFVHKSDVDGFVKRPSIETQPTSGQLGTQNQEGTMLLLEKHGDE